MVKKDDVISVIKEYCRSQIDKGEMYVDVLDFNVDIIRKIDELDIIMEIK